MAELRNLLARLQEMLSVALLNKSTQGGQALYVFARTFLGKDASPSDKAPDEYGCAESVSTLIDKLFGDMPIITGTYTLYKALQAHPHFLEVQDSLPGDVLISPTGLGNGSLVGHVGIVGVNSEVMSNNSLNGLWDVHYTLDSWRTRYQTKGGFPMLLFRRTN